VNIFHWKPGLVQSKVISLLIPASIILTPIAPVYAAFGDGTPTVPNKSLFTAQTEEPKIDGSTGAFTQTVPLDIPPGRNGMQPELSLNYSSQNTADGIVGYGWTLSIPYIERINKTGTQDLYGDNVVFASSIDGELTDFTAEATVSSISVLVVGGGGGGGGNAGGGGGGGGYIYNASYSLAEGSYPVVVGGGGGTAVDGTTGTASSFDGNSASGGGGGGTYTHDGLNGGSGGGAGSDENGISNTGGTGSLGNNGGNSTGSGGQYPAGGGGGAGAVGGNTSGTTAGSGGAGIDNSIDGTSRRYAGGGGGAVGSAGTLGTVDSSAGLGEKNGGAAAGDGIANRGGGGGGAYGGTGGDGGSGIVIISYPTSEASYYTCGGSTSTSGSSTICTYTASGTLTLSVDSAETRSYSPRVYEIGSNAYSFANNTWVVYDKKGTKYTYGSSASGRMYDTTTGTSTATFRWMLEEVRDTNGNYITYTYNRDNNVLYPYRVTYTGNGSSDGGIFTVSFATTTRSDIRTSYASGFAATTTKLISQITAAVNGNTVRQYDLSYGVGHNGSRSLLTSIQQKGYDDSSNLTTMPAQTFSYATSTTMYVSPGESGDDIAGAAYVIADTNGNAINDINTFMAGAGHGFVWVDNNGSGAIAVPDGSTAPPEYWAYLPYPYSPVERGVRYLDVNGDGKADVVRGWVDDQAGTSNFGIHYNEYATSTGTYGWTATSTVYQGVIPTFAKNTSAGLVLTGGLFGDVNGDGLPDYVTSLPGTFATTTYLGNGSAWTSTTTVFTAAKPFPSSVQTETASQLVDLNGDGLDDWVYSVGSSMYVLLNNGTGWSTKPDPRWQFASSSLYAGTTTPTTYYDRGFRFMDLNGDGLSDLVRSYQNTGSCIGPEVATVKAVYLNTGSGWATSTAYTFSEYITYCDSGALKYSEYGNFIGNGQMKQDVLSNVTYPRGGGAAITYANSASSTANPSAVISALVASKIVTNDARGNYATTSYSYTGGVWYTGSGVRDRRFAGFSPVTATGPDSVVATYFSQAALALIGRPLRKDVSDTSGTLRQRTFYRWDTASSSDNSTFVGLGRQITEDFAADGTHRDKATEYQYSTSTGDLIKIVDYGEVTGNTTLALFTDLAGDTSTTTITYAASSSVNMSVPVQKTVFGFNGATSSDQKYYYDSLPGTSNNTRFLRFLR
jgi:Glycine-rich domain/Salmonella virulence plasmid 65kDa B protein/FG-GAP-like repeat